MTTAGVVAALALRPRRRVPMTLVATAQIIAGAGLDGDHKGARFPNRGVTLLSQDDWAAALAELDDLAGPVPLPWTVRRANVLVGGVRLPRGKGSVITIGPARLVVTGETTPCARMDEAHLGLRRALAPQWRGGVTCRVLLGGEVRVGDAVVIEEERTDRALRLPG